MIALTTAQRVDHSALRTNQAFIVGLLALAYLLDSWLLVAFVAVVMLLGTVFPALGLFKAVYTLGLKPLGVLKPDVKPDDPGSHRFAQGFGSVFVLIAALALSQGWALVGWTLTGIVVALASLNLFAGICVGCLMYYQFGRLGIPGFTGRS